MRTRPLHATLALMQALSPNGVYRFTVFSEDGKYLLKIFNRETASIETNWLPEGQLYWSFDRVDEAKKFAVKYLVCDPGTPNDPRSYNGEIPDILQWDE